MKIKYQVFETAQVFINLKSTEGKGICTQRESNVLTMHGKKTQKTKQTLGCIVEPRDTINLTVNHAALQLNVDNS